MTIAERWLLPEGIEEILPPQAARIEALRRALLDEYHRWGYDLLHPPTAEYLESLLTGVGHDLDLLTFKITDQQTGRMMGVSADRTQQVARMDAHSILKQGVSRYCYCGSVLHTKKTHLLSSRSPMQIGAELYGYACLDSEIEIVSLMLRTLEMAQLQQVTVDLGHVGIYHGLVSETTLSSSQKAELYSLVRLRALPELDTWLASSGLSEKYVNVFSKLPEMAGNIDDLDKWRTEFTDASPKVSSALDMLKEIGLEIVKRFPTVRVHFDLAELKDFNYHTGLIFSAFVPGFGQAVARGGRYDATGEVFGRSRPATGFSCDLKILSARSHAISQAMTGILAPAISDASLHEKVIELRTQGERVIQLFKDQAHIDELGCDRALVLMNGQWEVQLISNNRQD